MNPNAIFSLQFQGTLHLAIFLSNFLNIDECLTKYQQQNFFITYTWLNCDKYMVFLLLNGFKNPTCIFSANPHCYSSFVVVGIPLYCGSCRGLLQCRRGLRPLQGCIAWCVVGLLGQEATRHAYSCNGNTNNGFLDICSLVRRSIHVHTSFR